MPFFASRQNCLRVLPLLKNDAKRAQPCHSSQPPGEKGFDARAPGPDLRRPFAGCLAGGILCAFSLELIAARRAKTSETASDSTLPRSSGKETLPVFLGTNVLECKPVAKRGVASASMIFKACIQRARLRYAMPEFACSIQQPIRRSASIIWCCSNVSHQEV